MCRNSAVVTDFASKWTPAYSKRAVFEACDESSPWNWLESWKWHKHVDKRTQKTARPNWSDLDMIKLVDEKRIWGFRSADIRREILRINLIGGSDWVCSVNIYKAGRHGSFKSSRANRVSEPTSPFFCSIFVLIFSSSTFRFICFHFSGWKFFKRSVKTFAWWFNFRKVSPKHVETRLLFLFMPTRNTVLVFMRFFHPRVLPKPHQQVKGKVLIAEMFCLVWCRWMNGDGVNRSFEKFSRLKKAIKTGSGSCGIWKLSSELTEKTESATTRKTFQRFAKNSFPLSSAVWLIQKVEVIFAWQTKSFARGKLEVSA